MGNTQIPKSDITHNASFSNAVPGEIKVDTQWGGVLTTVQIPVTAGICHPDFPEAFQVEDLFSEAECQHLLEKAEDFGFGKTEYPPSYRGNLRLITTDASLSAAVWERLKAVVPEQLVNHSGVWEAVGLNECWRLAKYRPGDQFKAHVDASFRKSYTEMSFFTVNIYMNGDFEGGTTRFYKDPTADEKDPAFVVVPARGRCCVFRQPPGAQYLHDGELLASGVKYLFRTDVMYRLKVNALDEEIQSNDRSSVALVAPLLS
eukprot:gene16567-19678_t